MVINIERKYCHLCVVCITMILAVTKFITPAAASVYRYCKAKPNQYGDFDCSSMKFTEIPTFLPPFTVALDLSDNWIQNPNSRYFLHLPHLKTLNLTKNKIKYISDKSFLYLENLEELDLSNNDIKSIPYDTFMNLKQLKILKISTSERLSLETRSFAGLSKLMSLELKSSSLHTQLGFRDFMSPSAYLENVSVSDYALFRDLSSLKNLRMQIKHLNCPVTSRYTYPPNLVYLDLSNSYLPTLCDFSNVAVLNAKQDISPLHLDLSHSNILNFHSNSFHGFQNVVNLNLSSNSIEKLESYFSNHLNKLQYLDISGNRLHYINSTAFTEFSNLLQLKMARNFIQSIAPHTFSSLSNLVYLDISNNRIKSLNLSRLVKLNQLDLSRNTIVNISSDALKGLSGLTKLKYLDLSGNAIVNINADSLQGLSNLQYLNLSHTQIDIIAPHTFSDLHNLVNFDLSIEHLRMPYYKYNRTDTESYCDSIDFKSLELFDHCYPNRSLEDCVSRVDSDYREWLSQFIGPRHVQDVSIQRRVMMTANDGEIHTYYFLKLCKALHTAEFAYIHVDTPWIEVKYHTCWLISDQQVAIQSVIFTMPHHTMPQCIDNERYIRIMSLHYRGFDETVHDVFTCFIDLKSLYLNNSVPQLSRVERDAFSSLQSLEILDLSNNNLRNIEMETLCVLDNLKELYLAANFLRFLDSNCLTCLPPLQILDLRDNPFSYEYYSGKAKECYHRGSSIDSIRALHVMCIFDIKRAYMSHFDLDSLQVLKLTDNQRAVSFQKCITTNLVVLDLSNTSVHFDYGIHSFPSMTHMTAQITELPFYQVKLVVPSLTHLDISHSSLRMNDHYIYFLETENLSYVDLSFTAFNDIHCKNHAGVFFENFTSLEYLNISHSGVMTLCDFYFKKLPMLTSLDASNNEISSISRHLFDHNKHLTFIDLGNNAIFRLELSTFSKLKNLVKLYFENNPFDCTYLSEMQDFMKSNISFTRDSSLPWQTYQCAVPLNIRGKPLLMVNLTDYTYSYAYIVTPVILLGIFTSTFLRRRKRDMILKQRPYYQQTHLIGEDQDLRYNAFVCFSSEDSDWVYKYLVPTLEETDPPLKLCIHDRDFELGKGILDNIEDEMERSQKFVFVVSKNFVKSKWCDHEMKCAFDKCMSPNSEHGRLIFLILEQVPEDEMSNMLKCHINTTTYLEFPRKNREESFLKRTMKTLLKEQWWPSWVKINEEEHFWRKLKQTLQKKEKNTLTN